MSHDINELADAAASHNSHIHGVLLINTSMSGAELGVLANRAFEQRLFGTHAVLMAMRFLADGNRIKNLHSKVVRICLAWDALGRAFQYKDALAEASKLRAQISEKSDQIIIACANGIDAKYHGQLARSKSSDRQWKISQKAKEELEKLRDLGDSHFPTQDRPWEQHVRRQIEYWNTQMLLLSTNS